MKKLLITLFSVAAAALTAGAAIVAQRGNTESFEGRDEGLFNPGQDDGNGTTSVILWERDENEGDASDSQVVVYDEEAPDYESTYGHNYLKVDESSVLRRKFANEDNNAYDEISLTNIGDGVYVKTRVQFTASEEDVEPDAADKLVVWMKEVAADEEQGTEAATNLMITAAVWNEDYSSKEISHYEVDNFTAVPGVWYDLTINAVNYDNSIAKFTVELDDTVLESGGISEFASLVAGGNEKLLFSSVGFKGTGAIDHIEMGTITYEVAKNFEVNGTAYETFAEALAAAQETGSATLKLLARYDAGIDGISINDGNSVIIDLNGQTITSQGTTLYAAVGIKVIDSAGGGKVETTAEDEDTYSIYAEEGATITVGTSEDNVNITFDGLAGGAISVYGGKFSGFADGTKPEVLAVGKMMSTDPIDGYYQLVDSGSPEEPTTYMITQIVQSGVTLEGVPEAAQAEDTEITFTATLSNGYKDLVVEVKTDDNQDVSLNIDGTTYTFNMPAAGVTISASATEMVTWIVNIASPLNEHVTDVQADKSYVREDAESKTVTLSATFEDGYELDYYTVDGTQITGNTFEISKTVEVNAVAKEKDWPSSSAEEVQNKTAEGAGLPVPDTLKGVEASKLVAWATGNGKVAYSDASLIKEEAYLLNVANDDEAIAEGKANFKIPAFSYDAEKGWVATQPEGNYNGKLVERGANAIGADVTWTEVTDDNRGNFRFFKYTLEVDDYTPPVSE